MRWRKLGPCWIMLFMRHSSPRYFPQHFCKSTYAPSLQSGSSSFDIIENDKTSAPLSPWQYKEQGRMNGEGHCFVNACILICSMHACLREEDHYANTKGPKGEFLYPFEGHSFFSCTSKWPMPCPRCFLLAYMAVIWFAAMQMQRVHHDDYINKHRQKSPCTT